MQKPKNPKGFYVLIITFFFVACGSPKPLDLRDTSNFQGSTDNNDQRPDYRIPDETQTNTEPEEPVVKEEPVKPTPPPVDPIQLGLSKFQKDNLVTELSHISADKFKGRLSATSGNIAVADYLISQLEALNIKPANGTDYRQSFKLRNGTTRGQTTSNIVGMIEGSDPVLKDEYIIVGAHMDHTGTLSLGYTCSNGGENNICNGADDNGSGSISVLNIAKALAGVRENLKRSVIIMWFSGEEVGLEGSWHYVQNPIKPLRKTVYMMNLDMVGYMDSNRDSVGALGAGTSPTAKAILAEINKKYPNANVASTERAGGGSDHVPFMDKGIPGVFFNTGVSNNRNYHRTSDTAEKIDYDGMLAVGKIAFELLFNLANNESLSVANSFAGSERPSLVTEEEKQQTCHHLILNPFVDTASNAIENGDY